MAVSSPPLSATSSITERVTFSRPGVAAKIGEEIDETTFVPGNLVLIEKPYGIFIEWTPAENPEESGDWVVTPPTAISFSNSNESVDVSGAKPDQIQVKSEQLKRLQFSVDIKDLRSFKCVESRRNQASPWVRFIQHDGTNYVPLYFRQGGLPEFIDALQGYATLKRSAKEANLILFTDEKTEALQQSVSMLFSKESQPAFLSKLITNPYATALTSLGKVANFMHENIVQAVMEFDQMDPEEQREAAQNFVDEMSRDTTDNLRTHSDADFELVTRLELPERPKVEREEPMNKQQWESFKTPEGRIQNVRELKLLIFRGGLAPYLRNEVWKFLLGFYSWDSTTEERQELRKRRVDDYYRMKLQWKSINEEQEMQFSEFRDRKQLVDKDVARTDRTHRFFEGDHNANVSMLNDILMTYVMYNFDLGYVQGMSDFLSPILVVMENEVDAFWAFVGLMKRMQTNFEMDQKAIKRQLMQLKDLLIVVNPKLANYLEMHNSDNMFFCFRWLLVHFKREFSFMNIMRMWEVLWTDVPCNNFHLLVCIAILDKQKDTIISNKFGFTEILKHINDMSMHIPLEETLSAAESIYHQLAATQDKLPAHVCDILGFNPYGNGSRTPSPEKPKASTPADNSNDSIELLSDQS